MISPLLSGGTSSAFRGRRISEGATCGAARCRPRKRSRTAIHHRDCLPCAASGDGVETCRYGNDCSVTVLLLLRAISPAFGGVITFFGGILPTKSTAKLVPCT